ncbi:nitrate reductase [Chachezhania sediminis]|uniref:nitrate reductase n=1 Tax=Chachezhania sediminis TaxID=2599291 RepID=UPI00131DC0D7|nr:nitrate reductase [Chachezhania sediminis]
MTTVRTTCPYCGVGCGVKAQLLPGDGAPEDRIAITGDPDHPANLGRLCSKGSALAETIWLQDRLLAPKVNGVDTSWDSALQLVADRFNAVIDEHGPDAVAFYVSGQFLTEDYYVANKLMKGFIGSGNIDTNSRLCMASSVAGHKRAFGTDTVPGLYTDLEEADLVVLVGSNLAWCHPVLYQRLVAAKTARPDLKVVTVDPRRTATADIADLHLGLTPGSDVALFNGLLVHLHEQGAVDTGFVLDHVSGFDEAVTAAYGDDLSVTGLAPAELEAFFRLWAGTRKVVTLYSQGVNQSSSGADKVNAILNCHLATGRIGHPGTGPFSVTGQPNAMGGREVGGLANMLACHLDIEDPAHRDAVRTFWDAPGLTETAGLKAVDMFRAVADGSIKAIWIAHTNPVVTLPEADAVKAALQACDFVVVSDITARADTARLADVLLPASAWGEKDGTVTNSERCISRQRAFLPAPGDTRPDWAMMAEVGRRMGHARAFDFASPAEIFREYAALSGIAGRFGRDFDISALAGITDTEYADLQPVRWPVTGVRTGGRFFGDGAFFTPDGKGRMLALQNRLPAAMPDADFPFVLNTGRIRDQWHTMTRTAKSPRLSAHLAEPFLEIHPADAGNLGLKPADLAQVDSPHGRAILRVRITDSVQPGQVFAPMHWTGENASAARIDAVVAAVTDPVSGQPETKAAVARVTKFQAQSFAFALSVAEPAPDAPYWARARARGGWRTELAWATPPADWTETARALFGLPDTAQPITVSDPARGIHRLAFFEGQKLVAALFAGPEPVAVSRQYLAGQLDGAADLGLLSGQPGADRPDPGAIVCSCFEVGVNTIRSAIAEQGLVTVEAIGAALRAGTNCGSCRPEIRALIEANAPNQMAAE